MARSSSWRGVVLVGLLLMLGACARPVPVAEMRAFGSAFQQLHAASDSLLAELAVAERRLGQTTPRTGVARPLGIDETFDPDRAATFATDGEPDLTRAYRGALQVIGAYTEGMIALAEGRPVEELRGAAGRLGREVFAVAAILGGAAALPALVPALPVLSRVAEEAGAAATRAAFQEHFLRGFPVVDGLLVEMRAGTAQVFPILARQTAIALRDARLAGASAAARAPLVARHEAYRTALSDWVLLLDEARVALREVKARLEAPPGLGEQVADLAERAARLRVLAASVRGGLPRGDLP
jgi:hypothetical protein